MKSKLCFFKFVFFLFISLLSNRRTLALRDHTHKMDSLPKLQKEFADIIYLCPTKNTYVEIKGTMLLSADVGGDTRNIKIAVQENSSILKLKALRKGFEDANMIAVCKDTVLIYLIRYSDNPERTYYSYDFAVMRNSALGAKLSAVATGPNIQLPMGGSGSAVVKVDTPLRNENGFERTLLNGHKPVDSESALYRWSIDKLERIRTQKPNITLGEVSGGIILSLDRLYTDNAYYYFSLTLNNRTRTDYGVKSFSFDIISLSSSLSAMNSKVLCKEAKGNTRVLQAGSVIHLGFAIRKIDLLPEEVLSLRVFLKGWDLDVGKVLKLTITHADLFRARDWEQGQP